MTDHAIVSTRGASAAIACSHDEGCITCGDVATEMRVLRIDSGRELALCESGDGSHHTVEIALVAAEVGDQVLVHAGTAIA
jgi:hypothetical protein